MGAVGGDILEVTWAHDTLGSGTFFPKSGEDSTFDLGGFRGADDANMVDGGGRTMRQLNRVRWSFEVLIAWDSITDLDLEKLTALAASPVEADWTVSLINGAVYAAKGSPVGDIQANNNNPSMTLKVSGGGVMAKQA
jgi:hypothetical protein